MALDRPIISITNLVSGTQTDFTDVPCELSMGRYDVSASTAGRDEAGNMHKEMIGKSVKLEMKFNNISSEEVRRICRIVEGSEYIRVQYVDFVEGSSPNFYVSRVFYVGDRSITAYNYTLDIFTLAFNLIEKGVH